MTPQTSISLFCFISLVVLDANPLCRSCTDVPSSFHSSNLTSLICAFMTPPLYSFICPFIPHPSIVPSLHHSIPGSFIIPFLHTHTPLHFSTNPAIVLSVYSIVALSIHSSVPLHYPLILHHSPYSSPLSHRPSVHGFCHCSIPVFLVLSF